MKNFILIIVAAAVSVTGGIWISQNLVVHFLIEEYYQVNNLDPANEKDAELLKQKIQTFADKNVPKRYRLNEDKFQCFKYFGQSIFFCSADTHRKKSAEYIRKLLQETVPQEIGWISVDEANEKWSTLKSEVESNKILLSDLSKQLDKVKKQGTKQATEEKKFIKTNDLYKKELGLHQKKIDVLNQLLNQNITPTASSAYRLQLEEVQARMDIVKSEMSAFHAEHSNFAENAQRADTLIHQIDEIKKKNEKEEAILSSIQKSLDNPNSVGKIAHSNELQLIPEIHRRKFEAEKRSSNVIWFSLVIFFVLTNFVLRLRPLGLIPFQEDATMTEAKIG